MAPEQKRGDDVDARSDLYAVGLICFQILTGEETPEFKKPSELQPGINPEWDTWLEKALHKSPDERFQTAESMKQALPKKKPVAQSSKADSVLKKQLIIYRMIKQTQRSFINHQTVVAFDIFSDGVIQ